MKSQTNLSSVLLLPIPVQLALFVILVLPNVTVLAGQVLQDFCPCSS